ncbi:pyrroloquinoline quinone biosynthesis protein PqqC [Streptomyces fodineus]|uniref:Pyrroloquinoline-quinone synthase n=1 Tax=Streptomyces fodineus TaxID=1904616 RepID=A0A1D7YM80_9ACTN|nr:pyrroloquinoline-quinone synthase PqqC [Streptomyces fodineus]AOR36624.1 pyrroloquinoline quinone biosynthesis protein PqqC [Streptomyces fodineus]
MAQPLTRERFAARLYDLRGRYWDGHPFHQRLHSGGCTPPELRRWVANRWYYQLCLTRKNAAIIANCPLPEVRRTWAERLGQQDGPNGGEGGLADWLVLAEAVGLDRAEVLDERHVARGVRFAVDGYLHFCQTRPWTEGVAAALTEMFSPDHMAARVTAWRRHYEWIDPAGYVYFEHRIPVARKDSARTLDLVLDHCVTAEQQQAALGALAFKCDVLNAMLDAVDYGAVR